MRLKRKERDRERERARKERRGGERRTSKIGKWFNVQIAEYKREGSYKGGNKRQRDSKLKKHGVN